MTRFAPVASLLLAAGTFAAAPAQAEVTESSDSHFVSRYALEVGAAPKDAWLALIAPGDWWNDSHTWSADAANMTLVPQAGGCFCETIPAEDGADDSGLEGSVQHMVVVQAVPRKVLRMRGALGPLQSEPVDGVLTITMQPIEGEDGDDGEASGTRIVWEYVVGGTMRFEVDEISTAVDGVIGEQAMGLADALGGAIDVEAEAGRKNAFDDAFGETDETPATGLGTGR
ncbi:SRPBCC family protein [Alteriqipengyuania sp. 357]